MIPRQHPRSTRQLRSKTVTLKGWVGPSALTSVLNRKSTNTARNPCHLYCSFVAHSHKSERAFEVYLAQEETCSNNDLLWFTGQMFLDEPLSTLVMRVAVKRTRPPRAGKQSCRCGWRWEKTDGYEKSQRRRKECKTTTLRTLRIHTVHRKWKRPFSSGIEKWNMTSNSRWHGSTPVYSDPL